MFTVSGNSPDWINRPERHLFYLFKKGLFVLLYVGTEVCHKQPGYEASGQDGEEQEPPGKNDPQLRLAHQQGCQQGLAEHQGVEKTPHVDDHDAHWMSKLVQPLHAW